MSNNTPLIYRVLKTLSAEEGGISAWHLAKAVGSYTQAIYPHLNRLVEKGVLKKVGSIFILKENLFFNDGIVMMYHMKQGQWYFLLCEYHGTEFCPIKCKGNVPSDCRKLKELSPDILKVLGYDIRK